MWHHVPNVDLLDRLPERQRHARAHRGPLEHAPEALLHAALGERRRDPSHRLPLAPALDRLADLQSVHSRREVSWGVLYVQSHYEAVIEDQPGGALGVTGGEEAAERRPLGEAQQRRPLRADGVHHRPDIVHPLLEGGSGSHRVRQPRAALVEHDQPGEAGQPLQEARDRRLGPLEVEVREPAPHVDEVEWALAQYLVGDVDIAALRVACLGSRHRGVFGQSASRPPADRA